jgi:hypothetical protein
MITQLDTTNWVSYPFEVNGVKFNSMLDPNGSFYPKVERLPDGVFTAENIRMTLELIGDPTQLTVEELQDELDRVNAGASEALVVLA